MATAPITCIWSHTDEESAISDVPIVSLFVTAYAQISKYIKEQAHLKADLTRGRGGFNSTYHVPLVKKDVIGRIYIIYIFPGIRHKKEKIEPYDDDETYEYNNIDGACDSSDSSSSSDHHKKHRKHKRHETSSTSSSSCDDDKLPHDHVYWCNSVGHVVTKKVSLRLVDDEIVVHTGEFLELQDDLSTKPELNTDEEVGRFQSEKKLWKSSRRPQERIVKCRFHFCESIAKGLLIFTLQRPVLSLEIETRPLSQCFVSTDGSTPHLMNKDAPVREQDLEIRVVANVYHLTRAERAQLHGEEQCNIMPYVQYHEEEIPAGPRAYNLPIPITIPFRHPVYALHWALQHKDHIAQKDWFNYSGLNGEDPMKCAKLSVGGKDLGEMQSALWHRSVEAGESFSKKPNSHIYTKCFSHCPEDETIFSGFLNFGAVKPVVLHIVPQLHLGSFRLKAWGRTLNLFQNRGGYCGQGWT